MNYKPKKEKYTIPCPEEIPLEQELSFTINPREEEQFNAYSSILALCKKLSKYCEIKMRLEFSKKMRLHAHGTIKINNYQNIFKIYNILWDHYKDYAIELSLIKEPDTWKKYCRKQRHIMKEYAEGYGWLYHIKNTKITKTLKCFFSQSHKTKKEFTQHIDNI